MTDDLQNCADFRGIIGLKIEWDAGFSGGKPDFKWYPSVCRGIVRGGFVARVANVFLLVERIPKDEYDDEGGKIESVEIERRSHVKIFREEKQMPGEGYRKEASGYAGS